MYREGSSYEFILCSFSTATKDLDLFGVLCNKKNRFTKKPPSRSGTNTCNDI